jgi:hypothetical protein
MHGPRRFVVPRSAHHRRASTVHPHALGEPRVRLVIEIGSGSVVNTFGSDRCIEVEVAPDGKHLYATCVGADKNQGVVVVVDTASGRW